MTASSKNSPRPTGVLPEETVIVTQSCPTLCNPMDCSPPGSSVHGILQARILEWIAIPFSRSSWPRDPTWVSCIAGRFFTIWATRGARGHRESAANRKCWVAFSPEGQASTQVLLSGSAFVDIDYFIAGSLGLLYQSILGIFFSTTQLPTCPESVQEKPPSGMPQHFLSPFFLYLPYPALLIILYGPFFLFLIRW